MTEESNGSTSEAAIGKLVRPALIASEYTARGYSMFLRYLLVGLADESVTAALVYPPGQDVDSVVSPSVEVIEHPAVDLPLMGIPNRKILFERLERFKPTVLHCLCESQASLTRQLARELDLPYILAVNSLQKRFGRLSISRSRCAKIIVPAKSIAGNVSELYPEFSDRIEQINIGTFVTKKAVCFSESGRLASMLTVHPLDNVGEFEKLIGAVKHLVVNGYEFMLVIMGGGRAESGLRELLASEGLLQTVIIIPRLEPWRSVLGAGDIFVQPQPRTAFDPLLLEAMSVGTAVAGCKGGVDDLFIDGQTAVVFDPNDELSIYSCLQGLFDRRELARKIAKGAQEYLKKNHTVSNMISSILRCYHEAQH